MLQDEEMICLVSERLFFVALCPCGKINWIFMIERKMFLTKSPERNGNDQTFCFLNFLFNQTFKLSYHFFLFAAFSLTCSGAKTLEGIFLSSANAVCVSTPFIISAAPKQFFRESSKRRRKKQKTFYFVRFPLI